MTDGLISTQSLAKFHPIHARHHPVTHNQGHIILFQLFQSLYPIFSRKNRVLIRETAGKEVQHFFVIIHNQHDRFILRDCCR